MSISFYDLKNSDNLCELLPKQKLMEVMEQAVQGYMLDDASRAEWSERVKLTMDIALQKIEEKNDPFPKASNVKYPLVPLGAIDFASRMYPELIQNDRVVKAAVIGQDPTGQEFLRAGRVAYHLSYQVLNEIPEWEQNLDKLLHILAIVGTVFKKTYYDPLQKCIISGLCLPERIIVDYNTESLDSARRITHLLTKDKNAVISRIRKGLYCDVDLSKFNSSNRDEGEGARLAEYLRIFGGSETHSASAGMDKDNTFTLFEQQCYLDLDGDGYAEPYVLTGHAPSMTPLRLVSCWDSVEKNVQDEIIQIKPIKYYTDFHFIPSPDGGFYSMGLGTLLFPINNTVNTLINQLIDSGTLSNTQSGLIGKGLRIKGGKIGTVMGGYHMVDSAPGQSLRDNIYPIPTKEPSNVLLELLQILLKAGADLIHSTEAMKGQGETQNVASGTVMAMIDQSMKVYNAIEKRLWRSLKAEYGKIAQLNEKYLTQKEYAGIIGTSQFNVKDDYHLEDMRIHPIADPAMSSVTQRLMKAQAILATPGVDRYQASVMFLQALQLDDATIHRLLPPPNPNAAPPPDQLKDLAQAELFKAQAQAVGGQVNLKSEELMLKGQQHQLASQVAQVGAAEKVAKIQKMQTDSAIDTAKVKLAKDKNDDTAAIHTEKLNIEKAKVTHDSATDDLKTMHDMQMDHLAAHLATHTAVLDHKVNLEKAKTPKIGAENA